MSIRRRRAKSRKHRIGVDVGPFLSIIVCVIGIVVLLISGLVAAGGLQEADQATKRQLLAQIQDSQKLLAAKQALAQRFLAAQQAKAQLQTELEEIQKQIDTETAAEKQQQDILAEGKKKLDELQQKLKDPDYLARLDLMRQIKEAQAALAAVKEKLNALPVQIADARRKANDAKGLVIIPLLTGGNRVKPVFIECHGAGLTVYRQVGTDIQQFSVRFDDIDSDSDLAGVIKDAVDNANSGQVLNLLVRPEGVKSYEKTIQNVHKANAPSTSIPITVAGKIQFRVPGATKP
jgi:multidrug efflux pump subunit AcrA (membrane-fusion protein)